MGAGHAVFVEDFAATGAAAMEFTSVVRGFSAHRLRSGRAGSNECE
jgi:hypothetical protein